jgi:putative YphP/YqiW family bacilliredoxin
MPYPEEWVLPGRKELTSIGFEELKTGADVDNALQSDEGTVLLVVNSICGCAAGKARPGIAHALDQGHKPDRLATVFAGQDLEATAQAREYMKPFPPSSPSVAMFKDGKLVFMMERHKIESREAMDISSDLQTALQEYC